MQKKLISLLLVLMLCAGMAVSAFAASDDAIAAATELKELGLFRGVGDNADGTTNFDLDRAANRMEAVTLLVRLLGKDADAVAGKWTTPFTDVDDWAKPYVGYAYENGLTNGISATEFGSKNLVSATQYLTFVLRALGYESGTDFEWDSAWTLTDELGITAGEYDADSAFIRADAAIVSKAALEITVKDGEKTLLEVIEENLANAPKIPEEGTKLGFTLDLPESWEQISDAELAEMNEMIAALLAENEVEMGGITYKFESMCADEESASAIAVMSISIPSEYKEEEIDIDAMLEGMGLVTDAEFKTLDPVTIGGREYIALSAVAEGVATYEYVSYADGEIICIIIACMEATSIDTILSYFK